MAIQLKALRIERGLTQQQMAESLNISKSTYNYWENGRVEVDFNGLNKLADFFDVSVDYLFGRALRVDNKLPKNIVLATDNSGEQFKYFIPADKIELVKMLLDALAVKNK